MAEARNHCIHNHYKDNIEVYSRTSGEGANQERSVTIVSWVEVMCVVWQNYAGRKASAEMKYDEVNENYAHI